MEGCEKCPGPSAYKLENPSKWLRVGGNAYGESEACNDRIYVCGKGGDERFCGVEAWGCFLKKVKKIMAVGNVSVSRWA